MCILKVINLDFMHTHLYLNFHLVYIHICKEENVSVCGACILVVKTHAFFACSDFLFIKVRKSVYLDIRRT